METYSSVCSIMSDNGLLAAPKTLPGSKPRKKVVLPDKPVEEAPARRGALPQFGDWEDSAIDGGGVGYTGIFQAKRNNRANGAPGGVMPPLQQEPLPPVVISKETPTKNLPKSMVPKCGCVIL